jgi:poly(A) polymerase
MDPPLQRVMQAIAAVGGDVRAVGGAVRDHLLGDAVGDVDLATTLLPPETVAALEKAGIQAIPTGLAHGTITARLASQNFEITSLRQDVHCDGRHATVQFGKDWAADAARRDFTINALYLDQAGTIYDYHNGLADLATRRVRFIGDPQQRLAEDMLRLLRFFRFAARYASQPDADGLNAATLMAPGLPQLSGERLWDELRKMLTQQPNATLDALTMMEAAGILPHLWQPAELAQVDLASLTKLLQLDAACPALLKLTVLLGVDAHHLQAIATRLRLSRSQQRDQQNWLQGVQLWQSGTLIDWLDWIYLHGVGVASESLNWWWAQQQHLSPPAPDGGYQQRLAAIARIEQLGSARFPETGHDLIAEGFAANADLATELQNRRRAWLLAQG